VIAVLQALVIASGSEDEVLVIDDSRKDGNFRADQTFFNQQSTRTETFLGENFVKEIEGRFFIRANRDAFSRSESIELEDGWISIGNRGDCGF
jgi:hypothetical protein